MSMLPLMLVLPLAGGPAPDALDARLDALRRALGVPGMAWALVEGGAVVHTGAAGETRDGAAFTTATPLRFASVTKLMTGLVLAEAVAAGRIDTAARVGDLLPEFTGDPAVTVAQLAAHVSEGVPGATYVYGTERFALLGPILEQSLGRPLEVLIRERLLEPAGARWYPSPHLGAHAGLVSTVDDVAVVVAAHLGGRLVSPAAADRLRTPYAGPGPGRYPVGLGAFVQEVAGEPLLWSFGQDDPDHSGALVVMAPERGRGFVLLANDNRVSDPFRLLMGDVSTSPFALAWLEHLGLDVAALEPRAEVLLALGRRDRPAAVARLAELLPRVVASGESDHALHYAAAVLGGEGAPDASLALAERMEARFPNDRWVQLFGAELYASLDRPERSAACWWRILALRNQEPDLLHRLFRAWAWRGLASLYRHEAPERAQACVERGLATGVTGETRDDLVALARQLGVEVAR